MLAPEEAVGRVFDALMRGRLTKSDLTARRLTAHLGASTIVLYHHFGSLDGFLIRVDGMAWKHLLAHLLRLEAEGGTLSNIASAYLDFAFDHPDVYWLMAERRFDRPALKKQNRLRAAATLWNAFVGLVERGGAPEPQLDAHLLLAALHGLVSLVASERGNLGEGPADARHLAHLAARHLTSHWVPKESKAARAPVTGRRLQPKH